MSKTVSTTTFTFVCPKCKDNKFGSSGFGNKMQGHCHSDSYCGFTWPRSEDRKYFVIQKVTTMSFEDTSEFEEAERAAASKDPRALDDLLLVKFLEEPDEVSGD